jgi:16S rRNA G966 N2-methylase RsmD|tara:strand:+ start:1806 stop:2450 length:645 start_codon:yes stop_codon:yes gene_type:complete
MTESIKVGEHITTNVSIEKADLSVLLEGNKANIFYSDPPWSDGNLKYWNTMRNKMSGTTEDNVITLEEMTLAIQNIIKNHTDGYVVLETGKAAVEFQTNLLKSVVHNIQIFDVFYRSGSRWLPNKILVGATNPKYKFDLDLNGVKCDGFVLPDMIFEHIGKQGDIVLDPFMGLCNTGMAAIKRGMKFAGNEFNSVRYNKALASLEKYRKKYDRA